MDIHRHGYTASWIYMFLGTIIISDEVKLEAEGKLSLMKRDQFGCAGQMVQVIYILLCLFKTPTSCDFEHKCYTIAQTCRSVKIMV